MTNDAPPAHANELSGHVIIAGFGIVGRYVADMLAKHQIPFCVLELNPTTCERLNHGPVPIIEGDAVDEAALHQAGIARASAVALAMPDEKKAMDALHAVRAIRPDIKVIIRCTFTSAGLLAGKLGATAVVAEQVVAKEFATVMEKALSAHPA